MDLEQRMQALEQEVQILKNQIQATLLDVQEQLLTNAYPSLIAADSSPSNDTGQSFTPPQRQYLHTVTPDSSSSSEEEASTPNVRRVSLSDLQGTPAPEGRHSRPTETTVDFHPTPNPQPVQSADWSTLTELEDWVSNKVEKMGVERTRKLVHMYAEKGHFARDEAESLLQIVSLYDRPSREPTPGRQSNGNHRGEPSSSSQRAKSSREAQRPKAPSSRPAGRSTAQPQHRSQPAPQRNHQPAPRPNGREQITRPEPSIPTDESFLSDDSEQSQNLVLRLIAGVQNAGAGVKWSKKHG